MYAVLITSALFISFFGCASPFAAEKIIRNEKINPPKHVTANDLRSLSEIFEMQKKYQSIRTLTAEFTQKQISAMDSAPSADDKKNVSTGNIFIERDPKRHELKFRWQILAPSPSLAVSNGKKFWLYTPPFREGENGQVQIRNAAEIKSALLADLLLANRPLKKTFDIKALECTDSRSACFELRPKKETGDLDYAELHIERPTNLVYKVVIISIVGNRTELELKNIKLNPKLGKNIFEFKVPARTEVIK